MVWDNFCRRILQKINSKKNLGGCRSSLYLVGVVVLLVAGLPCFVVQNVWSNIDGEGGGGVFLVVEPLLDRYVMFL
jgi:hypothetical protein